MTAPARRGAGTSPPLVARAPAKINLGLFVGPTRADGRHELVTVMQSISLADELVLVEAPSGPARERGAYAGAVARAPAAGAGDRAAGGVDVVLCPGVPGPPGENLAARALAAFRAATGWAGPPLELRIDKRVPVAAGLGGGSGDAAAALRLAAAAAGCGADNDAGLLQRLARELGADVPAQVRPGRWLASGAGERLQELAPPAAPFGVLVLPSADALATAAVYVQADRMGLARSRGELRERHAALGDALAHGLPLPADAELLANDLQDAARALCPSIDVALAQARTAGADVALVSGSGPTVLGLFAGADGPRRAQAAADGLAPERAAAGAPAPCAARSVEASFGAPRA